MTPFVVAGVEFSKRIVKQRKCEVCGGSGLVLKKKYYRRCPNCGTMLYYYSFLAFNFSFHDCKLNMSIYYYLFKRIFSFSSFDVKQGDFCLGSLGEDSSLVSI